MRLRLMLLCLLPGFAACGAAKPAVETASVTVVNETEAVESRDDAADDPAIWRHAADPAASLIVSTDKKAGLYVHGIDGKRRSFLKTGRLNNVDLRDAVRIGERSVVLVAASDRDDPQQAMLSLFTLDTAAGTLKPLARLPAIDGEGYGLCLWRRAADLALFAFLVTKQGRIAQLQLDFSGAAPVAKRVRTLALKSQSEGCVADDRTGQLYVAEEDVGIWRFAADPAASVEAQRFARVDGKQLVADVEGLALAAIGEDDGYLLASSQGDNAYAVYGLRDARYAGRFRLVPNAGGIDGTRETDGIELMLGDFGADYPGGLFIAQDGDNAPQPQNFKLTSWQAIVRALPQLNQP